MNIFARKNAKKEYTEILNSGMFFVWYSELTGDWERDEDNWYVIYQELQTLRGK